MAKLRFFGRNLSGFYFSSGGGDWTVPQNDALWQDNKKTLFDPCPAGWRVPRGGTDIETPWPDDLLTQVVQIPSYPGVDGGYELPAYPVHTVLNICGGRSCANGKFLGNSERGWWWSASLTDAGNHHARTLSIYLSKAVNQTNPRGDCFSVRCVRE